MRTYRLFAILVPVLATTVFASALERDQAVASPPDPTQVLLRQILEEMSELRKSITTLRESVNILEATVITDLQRQNDKLRNAVRLRYERLGGSPPVPMPNRALIQQIYRQEQTEKMAEGFSPIEPQDFKYTIVSEWGRSPEVAEQATQSTASLKGMVLSVPPGSTDADLSDFAINLRRELDAYDNINIEVFDGIEAARRYAQTGASDAHRRVLSISKFRESERDVILLIRGDTISTIDIPSQ